MVAVQPALSDVVSFHLALVEHELGAVNDQKPTETDTPMCWFQFRFLMHMLDVVPEKEN